MNPTGSEWDKDRDQERRIAGDRQGILAALHGMEVRFTERLTRIESESAAWRKTHDDLRDDITKVGDDAKAAAIAVATTQAADSLRLSNELRRVENECNRQSQRLTIGLIIVAVAAAGRLAVNVWQLVGG